MGQMREMNPMKRFGTSKEIAKAQVDIRLART